jgi:rsbT co-antagonist protein RsbR
MSADERGWLSQILEKHEAQIFAEWVDQQRRNLTTRPQLIQEDEAREQSRRFLAALRKGVGQGRADYVNAHDWSGARDLLGDIARAPCRASRPRRPPLSSFR